MLPHKGTHTRLTFNPVGPLPGKPHDIVQSDIESVGLQAFLQLLNSGHDIDVSSSP